MTIRQLPLRVLYTVNSSPQYILARSTSSVQVTFCPSPSVAHAQYGLAPLKSCLNAICNSSPELLLDNSRDFSIYVLDPLESQTMPAPVDFSQSNAAPASMPPVGQPRGVAVALGLMSWALTADESDSVAVTGTITSLGTGLDALELVFALRETKHVQKSYLTDALKCWGQPHKVSQPTDSIPPPKSTDSEAPLSLQEPGRPLTKSADFPEVYIGPPKRARGRPEAANKKPKQSKARKPVRPGAPPFICAPLVRSQYQYQQPQPAPPTPLITLLSALSGGKDNTALLAALSTIDSAPPGSEPSPVLLNALRDLLATQSHTQQPTHALQPVSRNNQDDEIVILEKEHVDPTAFRRRVERDDSSKSATTTADESEMTPQRRIRIPSGGKENTYSPSLNRKRRLSDFMAEQENDQARRKRTHSRSGSRRTSCTFELPQPAVSLDYLGTARSDCDPSVPFSTSASSTLSHTKSSPSRPMLRSASDSQASFAKPPPETRAPVKPAKHFVIPEWARTSTVTQPRLSKETEERLALLEEEKKWKRAARRTQKTGSQRHRVGAKTESSSEERNISGTLVHEPAKEKAMPRPQSTLTPSLPVFASDVSISSPPSSPVSEKSHVPSTPPRKTAVLRATPRNVVPDCASPLFSPTPKSLWRSTRKTPLFSPHPRTPSRVGKMPLFSPLHLRTPSTKISPLGLGLNPRPSLEWTSKSAEQPVDREEEDLLGKELDEALQGLEVPRVKHQRTYDPEIDDNSMTAPLSPLPPSSPPPPTSPLLLPSTDDAMEEFINSEAFFSDSDAVLGDGSELPPSMISDWLSSDDDGRADMSDLTEENSGVNLEGAFLSNVFADMDFTEFWQSLKPLLQTNGEGETTVTAESGGATVGDVDHGKLTQEVQVLLGLMGNDVHT